MPVENESEGKSRKKKKEANANKKKGNDSNGSGASTPQVVESNAFKTPMNGTPNVTAAISEAEAALSSDDKKRRALMKKLTAIDQLKVKKASGEKLELTQHKKLESEEEIRKELASLD